MHDLLQKAADTVDVVTVDECNPLHISTWTAAGYGFIRAAVAERFAVGAHPAGI
jgi:hypothetical protein